MRADTRHRPAVLRAELLRWRRSAAHRLVYVAAIYGIAVSGMFFLSGMGHSWSSLGNWANIWAVTVGPLYAVLLGATITGLDIRTRAGGTQWRRVEPSAARAARLVVLVGHVVAANATALLVPLLGGMVAGLNGHPPVTRMLVLVGVCGLSQAALARMAVVLAQLFGMGWSLTIGVAFAMSWIFVNTVETDAWMSWPANWLVRGTMPLTGTHTNGTALAPHSPLWHVSLWAPAGLSLALAAVLSTFDPKPVGTWIDRMTSKARRNQTDTRRQVPSLHEVPEQTRTAQPARRVAAPTGTVLVAAAHGSKTRRRANTQHILKALTVVLKHSAAPWIGPALMGVGLVFLRWQPASTVALLESVILLPLVASILPMLMWSALAPGWRMVGAHPSRFIRPTVLMVLGAIVTSSLLAALTFTALVAAGLSVAGAVHLWLTCTMAALFICPAVTWLDTRFGSSVAGAVSIFGVIFGVLIGGTGLITRLWPVAPWAWGALPLGTPALIAAPIAAIIALAATPASGRASVRAALTEA